MKTHANEGMGVLAGTRQGTARVLLALALILAVAASSAAHLGPVPKYSYNEGCESFIDPTGIVFYGGRASATLVVQLAERYPGRQNRSPTCTGAAGCRAGWTIPAACRRSPWSTPPPARTTSRSTAATPTFTDGRSHTDVSRSPGRARGGLRRRPHA